MERRSKEADTSTHASMKLMGQDPVEDAGLAKGSNVERTGNDPQVGVTWDNIGRLAVHVVATAVMCNAVMADAAVPMRMPMILDRFTFLTVQILWILLLYFSLCAVSETARLFQHPLRVLDEGLHWVSSIAGALGISLTIGFYMLVWSDPSFHTDVVKHFTNQGINFDFYCHGTHAPSVVLALVDAFAKRPDVARRSVPSPQAYLLPILAFVAWYACVLNANFQLTHEWPYPFLYSLSAHGHAGLYLTILGGVWAVACLHRWLVLSGSGP